jgi:hypothetical protein
MTWKDPDNKLRKNVLLMCNNTIRKNYTDWVGEINRTLAHEAVHVAQMCKEGKGYVEPLGFKKDIEEELLPFKTILERFFVFSRSIVLTLDKSK